MTQSTENTEKILEVLTGKIDTLGQDIKQEFSNLKVTTARLEEQVSGLDNRLKIVEAKLDSVNQIDKRLEVIDTRIKAIENSTTAFTDIDRQLVKIDTRLDEQKNSVDKIPDLAEKVGELKNWRRTAIIIITGTVGTIFGWFLKS